MSGGGGGNSEGSGGNTNASARAAMTSDAAYNGSGISGSMNGPAGGQSSGGNYSGGTTEGNGTGNFSSGNDNREQYGAVGQYNNTPQTQGTVDSENEYMSPDRDHWNQTQNDVKKSISGLGDNYQADWSDLSKDQKTEYQKNMNEVKGTTDKNYSWYAGNEGTINNTFAENWKDSVVTSPALRFSPTLRFMAATAKTIQQNATTSYGTGDYGGVNGRAVDKGGWLGKLQSGELSNDFIGTPEGRGAMNEIAPHAPYMVSGITKPTDSPAAKWYANLGTGSTNPGGFNLATEYAAAKQAIATKLGTKGPIGMLAVNDSPYYDWLKTNKLDKGIL
jgi:hypothetical protein